MLKMSNNKNGFNKIINVSIKHIGRKKNNWIKKIAKDHNNIFIGLAHQSTSQPIN